MIPEESGLLALSGNPWERELQQLNDKVLGCILAMNGKG
jgi:hypothetical protein